MTPANILKRALDRLDSLDIGPLSLKLGIPRDQIVRAKNGAHGQPTRAEYHLKLCAWLGVDPLKVGKLTLPETLIEFDAVQFAIAVKMARYSRHHTMREAASAMGISATVLTRIQFGEPCSFDSIAAAMRYGRLDLKNYVRPVSYETSTRNRSTENRSAA